MNSRERVKALLAGEPTDRVGFWLGEPHAETWPIYLKHFGLTEQEDLRKLLGDDLRWIYAETGGYYHPDSKPMFTFTKKDASGRDVPYFADCEDVAEVEDYDWPKAEHLNFDYTMNRLQNTGDYYRASGMWSPFFHMIADLFGMENYFVKMHTNPDVVDAVTRKVCDFYYDANVRFFDVAGDEVDAFFFGNDFGTQLDTLISPKCFDRFIMPDIKRLIDLGHSRGYQVMSHSCGAVHKFIDRYIDAGLNGLHPLQAKAANMDAETLARDFKGRLTFIGGIDTQYLLIHATPEQVKQEVRRVKALLGPRLIVSPSHECLLPNVPPENVLAMAEAALE
ncbi:MAG: uroporphyrinogen decarboxylase family protein [Armatimonadota bacterium]